MDQNSKPLDLLIVGGSAAATAAGIYAARRGLNFKIITKDFGGEVVVSGEIGNYPGFTKIDGVELTMKFKEHLRHYNVDIEEGVEVAHIVKQEDGLFCITPGKGKESKMASERIDPATNGAPKCGYLAKTVIVATGVHPRQLGMPGEKEFRNKGVSYCTTCDGPLFTGKTVATVGGGNSALESGLMLSGIAEKVYVINKNPKFKGDQMLINNLRSKKNVTVIYSAKTTEIMGTDFVTGLKYTDEAGIEQTLDVEGIFVHIGMIPNSDLVPEDTEKDNFKQIIVNMAGETNVSGLYAAGDVTNIPYNQIAIAVGQGTTALLSAVSYLNKLES
ncbi:MAG: FAD-dependent oxidoreductase [Parcubacteria group bacterium]